jgi:hypothetical protein
MKKLPLFLIIIIVLVAAAACASPEASPHASATSSGKTIPTSVAASTTPPAALPAPTPILASITPDQQAIIDAITAELKQQGVPIVSANAIDDSGWNPAIPVVIEYVLRQTTNTPGQVPDNPFSAQLVGRSVNMAQRQGLNASAVSVAVVDGQGKVISRGINKLVDKADISDQFDPPLKLTDAAVSELLQKATVLEKITINKIDVHEDIMGYRQAVFNLQAPDVETANAKISGVVGAVRQTIDELNLNQGTQIPVYLISVTTTDGEWLLKYRRDVQLGNESSWLNPKITNVWYPHPPSMPSNSGPPVSSPVSQELPPIITQGPAPQHTGAK